MTTPTPCIKTFLVSRFDPEKDKQPEMREYRIDVSLLKGKMLLHALEAIKEQLDSSLSFRRSCAEGVCGSDGMNINGQNGLACITALVDLPNTVVIQPLPGFPIICDLVVDMEPFLAQYRRVKPYLQNQEAAPLKERLQSPEDRAKLDGLYECILCACCTSSCPSYWWNPDQFVGPQGLLTAYRFIVDSRDTQASQRLKELNEGPYQVYRCRTIMNCTTVCPKGLNPAKAIAGIRTSMVFDMIRQA